MDIATIIGFIAGISLILWSIMIGGSIWLFFHVPSLMITVGGTISAILMQFPLEKVLGVFSIVKKTIVFVLPKPESMIGILLEYNALVRKEGVNVLEDKLENLYPFLRNGLQMILDNTAPETIRDILTTEMECSQVRHSSGKKILETMGTFGPAFGMLGTVIGLVQMLQSLEDPSQIGQGMAVALITTFYGSFIANLICLPLAGKLEARDIEEQILHELIMHGVLAIQSGEHPYIMKERLKAYLSTSRKKLID
ncbi:MAG: MotA/TolQ/ExbB proton channel family protein [Candidatus Brocadiae bacterium]|nr:MotA/TolQ/ExbB proton channel family protein [Candidatus Brocadiia bacterium]